MLLGTVVLLGACVGATLQPLADWAGGPVRWLLLPEEREQLRGVHTETEARAFVQAFWSRRDPAVVAAYSARVAAADELYAEKDCRGSLTVRGRALVLLGPPRLLRTAELPVPAWRPETARGAPAPRATVRVETWSYPLAELPPAVRDALGEEGRHRVEVSFVVEPDRTRLRDGADVLDRVRRAIVRAAPKAR